MFKNRNKVISLVLAILLVLSTVSMPELVYAEGETATFGVVGYNAGDDWPLTVSKALRVNVGSLDTNAGGYSIKITIAKGMKLNSYLWNTADPTNWPTGDGVQGTQVPMDNSTNEYFNGGSVSIDDDGNTVLIYNTSEGCSSMNLTDKILVMPDERVTYGSDSIGEAIKFELLDSTGTPVSTSTSSSVSVTIAKDQITNSSYPTKRIAPGTENTLLYEVDYYRKGLSSIGQGIVDITLGIPECVDEITKLMDISAGGSGTEIPSSQWSFDVDNHILIITGYETKKDCHFKCGIYGTISDTATVGKNYYDDLGKTKTKFDYTVTYDNQSITYDITQQDDFTNISRYGIIIGEAQDSLMLTDYISPTYGDFPDGYPSLFGLIRSFHTSNAQDDDQMVTWEFDDYTLDVIGVCFPLDPNRTDAIIVTDIVFNGGIERHGLNLPFDKYTTNNGKAYSTRYLNVADLKAGDPTIPDSAQYIRSITANCGRFSAGFATDNGYGKPVGYFNQAVIDAGVTKEIEYRFRVNAAEPQTLSVTYDPNGEVACLSLVNTSYKDASRQVKTTSLKAGETIYMSTRVVCGGTLSTYEPRFYLVVPQWMSFDPSQMKAREWITSYSSGNPEGGSEYFNDSDIKYEYSYVQNAAGEYFTCYEFYVEGESVGTYLERPANAYVKWNGHNSTGIVFEYPLTIEDTAVTRTIDFNDYLFAGKGNINTGNFLTASGHSSGYNHPDSWDFDRDGNRSETNVVVSVPNNNNFSIMDNANITVSGYLTHQGSSDAVNPYDPGPTGNNEVNVVEFMPGDYANYHVTISNKLVSIGNECAVNAYIPIPNGTISAENKFTAINTYLGSRKYYQFDEYQWPMELRGLIQNTNPNNFDIIYYLDSVTIPSANESTGEPVAESPEKMKINPTSLTAEELDRVVLVEIKSRDGVKIPNGSYAFTIPLKVGVTETQATAANMNLTKNIFRPRYHRAGGIGDLWVNGNYVAARLAVASIGGSVFEDENGNGHWDSSAGESGIGGVTVELYKATETTPMLTKYTSSESGQEGKYSFTAADNGGAQIPAGTYRIRVYKPTSADGYVFTKNVAPTEANYKSNSEAVLVEGQEYAEMQITIPYEGVFSGYQEFQNAGLFIDKVGGGAAGDEADGVPDAYQVRVNYSAVNGSIKAGEKTFEYFHEVEGTGYTKTFDLTITNPPKTEPTNANYDFDNWSNNQNTEKLADGKFTFANVNGGETIEVQANYRLRGTFQIRYNKNTTDTVKNMPTNQSKQQGVDIALSSIASESNMRMGHIFNGWNTDPEGNGTTYYPGEPYTKDEDVDLYAQWLAVPDGQRAITIKHHYYTYTTSATPTNSLTITVSRTYLYQPGEEWEIPILNREGFTLRYSEAAPADVTKRDGKYIYQSDSTYATTVNIKYDRTGYSFTFDANGGSIKYSGSSYAKASVQIRNQATVSAFIGNIEYQNPTRDGYTFIGWDREIPEKMPMANVTLMAQWKPNPRTVTFNYYDANGNPTSKEFTVDVGADVAAAVEEPEVPNRVGYDFKNWDPEYPDEMPNEDIVFNAVYKAKEYTINYVLNGGTATNPETYTIESEPITLNNPTKAGFTFQGWTGTGLTEATTTVTIPTGSTGDRTYTANWPSTAHYTVNHYQQNLDGSYPTTPTASETMYGSIGVDTAAVAKTYTGFTAQPFNQKTIVDTSGGADPPEIDIYYNRTTHTITWKNEDGTELETDTGVMYGATPEYNGETPTKVADAQYTYTFKGWTPTIAEVTGDITYTAIYNETLNKYKVTFVNEDGTELQSADVEYGTIPTYTGETPTKPGDAQNTFIFAGWNPVIEEVKGEATYKAQYTHRQYKITWKNYNGDVLDEKTVEYGQTMPSYDGAEPTKPSTDEYSYMFNTWVPDVTPVGSTVTRNVTFTASYTESKRSYTISFVGEDGTTVLQSTPVEYGEMPSYTGEIPTKDGGYTFAGWEPALEEVKGDATYKATFIPSAAQYTVTWKNYDGAVLYEETVNSGAEMPAYKGEEPTKPTTDEYSYEFNTWVPDAPVDTTVTRNVTFTASYTETKITRSYTIKFVNEDGTELQSETLEHGTVPTYNGQTPTRPGAPQNAYTFAGWEPTISEVTADATYTAQFAPTPYTIKWKNYDGAELATKDVKFGETMPSYEGEVPTKPATTEKVYTFSEWVPDSTVGETVTGNVTFTASFTESARTYTIKFVNDDGTELQTLDVEYGLAPKYTGKTPTKEPTVDKTFVFDGWVPVIEPVKGDATYKALFNELVRKYSVKWLDEDGTELASVPVEYNDDVPAYPGSSLPTKAETEEHTFEFERWESDVEVKEKVECDIVYTAVYSSHQKPIEYYYSQGDNSEWTQEDGKGANFRVSRNINDASTIEFFVRIDVDEKPVDQSQYVAESGSVKITLKPEYIDSLEVGDHRIKAVFVDGEAEAKFKVVRPTEDPGEDPGAGEDPDPGVDPGTDPGAGEDPDPGTDPGTGEDPDPGVDPGTDPGTGEDPDPGVDPGTGGTPGAEGDTSGDAGAGDEPAEGGTPGGENEPSGTPGETVPDGNTSGGNAPSSPSKEAAPTGDESNIMLWLLVALVAAATALYIKKNAK